MRDVRISRLRAGAAVLAIGAALLLAGCNRANELTAADNTSAYALPDLPATLPLSGGDATPLSYAPQASALPDVAPIRTVRVADSGQSYAYADNAYGFADALGDAPPDYAFDYDGADPWAWQGYDDSSVFAEPIDDGYRYYYYRAGADQPYFVRDPDYGYGYDGGQLAVVYAADGGIVPWADYGPRVVYASRYLVRGRDLYRASRRGRRPVIAANWAAHAPAIFQSRRAWREAAVRQPGWASYRQVNAPRAQQHWREEAVRRQADARRYVNWRARGFQTPPPPRAIPANWQRANWARDERRFAPVRGEQITERRDQQQAIAARQQAQVARREQRAPQQQRAAALAQRADRGQAQAAQQAHAQQARAQREQAQAQRQQAQQARAGRDQAERAQAAQRTARQQAQQTRAAEQAQRQQAQKAERSQRAQARQAETAQGAQRQQAQQARQAEATQHQQAQQAQAAERAQRQQARRAEVSQRAERQQAQQARQAVAAQQQQAQAAQAAERAQRQQAQQAQAADRAQRQQAQAAQAQQSQARAAQQQQRAAAQAERAQAREARPAREGRPPRDR